MNIAMHATRAFCAALLAACVTQAAAVGSLADITVFDRSEGRQLPVYWHEGRAWVAGNPGNEYAVRIRNRGRDEVLAVISVDGVNAVSGETASPQQSGYVLSPWRQFELTGWRRNLGQTAAFYFTPLPDSYASRTGRPDNVGVIGVALFRKKAPPPAELSQAPMARAEASKESRDAAGPGAAASAPAPAQKLGTGHGRTEVSHARYVGFERATSYPAETVSLYYDSHQNLVARGIIPRPVPVRPVLPRPFPGFVPDPPA
ncbi:MAG: hypothetical protein ACT4P9_14955 [Betaproteobacteria bacterium]